MLNVIYGVVGATLVYGIIIFLLWRNNKKKFVEVLELIDTALQTSTLDDVIKEKFQAFKDKFLK
jgi:hypothetical protein